MNKICPDCKGNIEMELIDTMYLDYKESYQKLANPYYKCSKCKQEYDEEDLWA